ncbi:MAG: hypothetical protein JSS66_14750 [Armatimonadetes bacterium]|nr:hypothetical protein [Armatimonadota bacterium]
MANTLDPICVAIFPRFSEATGVVSEMLRGWTLEVFAVALAGSEEQAKAFRSSWPDENAKPLLLLQGKDGELMATGVAAISEIVSRRPSRPLAVFVVDGPEVSGFKEQQRAAWNRDFSREIAAAVLDVQVFEYNTTWATSPPRVR